MSWSSEKYCRWTYISTALVELTRFGTEPISKSKSTAIIDDYICKKFGPYDLVELELGVVPMYMDFENMYHPGYQNNIIYGHPLSV